MQRFTKNACPVQTYFERQLADARESDCHILRGLGCYRLALKKLWSTLRRSDFSRVKGGISRICLIYFEDDYGSNGKSYRKIQR